MSRTIVVAFLLVFAFGTAGAQAVTVTPIVGGTVPLSGHFAMWRPVPSMAGFDSTLVRHEYQSGLSFGALVELARARGLGVAAQFTVNLAERTHDPPSVDPCEICSSTIYTVALMVTRERPLSARTRLHLMVGPEIQHLTGDATSNEGISPPPHVIRVDPTTSVGALASAGVSIARSERVSWRVQLAYRYHAPHYEPAYPELPPDISYESSPYQSLLLTAGATWRLR